MPDDHATQSAAANAELALFRPEVLSARERLSYGQIDLARPISTWLIVFVSTVLGACVILLIMYGSVTSKATVTGITVPTDGVVSVTSPSAGVLLRSLVTEGQIVRKGQLMFEVSTERQSEQGEISALVSSQLKVRLAMLERERSTRLTQEQEHIAASDARFGSLQKELSQIEHEISLTTLRNGLAQQSVEQYAKLHESGFVSTAQQQQKQADEIDVSLRLASLNREKVQLTTSLLAAQADREALAGKLSTDIGQIDGGIASLRQEIVENDARKTTLVVAPQAGIVSAVTYQQGQSVTTNQMLTTLVPSANSEMQVHLYAPSRAVGFVSEGQKVLIRYQAYPYQKFGLYSATVLDVSKTPFAPNELPPNLSSTILSANQQTSGGTTANETLYRIKVKLDHPYVNVFGKPKMLKPGMVLEADILQERRAIWEWILEPVLAVAPH